MQRKKKILGAISIALISLLLTQLPAGIVLDTGGRTASPAGASHGSGIRLASLDGNSTGGGAGADSWSNTSTTTSSSLDGSFGGNGTLGAGIESQGDGVQFGGDPTTGWDYPATFTFDGDTPGSPPAGWNVSNTSHVVDSQSDS